MGDDHRTSLRSTQFVEPLGYDTEGIHIETRVRFVEDGKGRFQHGHLEDFVTFLLATTEAFVHTAVGQLAVQLHDSTFLAHQFQELAGGEGGLTSVLALFVHGCTHKVHHAYAGNLHGVLEGEKDALVRTVFGTHLQQVLTVEGYASLGHFVGGMPHEHIAQSALTGTVLSHQGMYFAIANGEVDAFQYLFAIDTGM